MIEVFTIEVVIEQPDNGPDVGPYVKRRVAGAVQAQYLNEGCSVALIVRDGPGGGITRTTTEGSPSDEMRDKIDELIDA